MTETNRETCCTLLQLRLIVNQFADEEIERFVKFLCFEGLQTASRDITQALDPAPTMQSSVFELIPRLRSSGSRSGIDETSKDDFAFRKAINVTFASTHTPQKNSKFIARNSI
jgi:hypothetical protein